ncbi:MAG: acetolactate synthase small subunit, partial [Candidatus Omnitrophica bacterium]|nr:acetolactate synthase small subunit [Candidatus Omnitrophota bacterium]
KQLNKLIDVVTITDFTKKEHIDRELILVKIDYSSKDKTKLENILSKHVAKLIQHKADVAIIEAVGEQAQIRQLLEDLSKFGIKELIRTGRIAITK